MDDTIVQVWMKDFVQCLQDVGITVPIPESLPAKVSFEYTGELNRFAASLITAALEVNCVDFLYTREVYVVSTGVVEYLFSPTGEVTVQVADDEDDEEDEED